MKHRLIHRLAPAFMAATMGMTLSACADQSADIPGAGGDGYITISLSNSSAKTRATTPGEDPLNENLIGTTHLFFYTAGSGDTAQPVYETTVNPNVTSSATVKILLDRVNSLFSPDSNTCEVFAISNVSAESLPGDHSRQALKQTSVTSPFERKGAQDAFAMSGENVITLNDGRTAATGSITLKRSAAKIIVSVDVSATTQDTEDKTWTSDHTSMFVSMAHGVKTSDLVASPSSGIAADKKYTIPITTEAGHGFKHHDGDPYPCVQEIPFYTYPNQWTSEDSDRPYITLMVPWQQQDVAGASAQYCYYQIPINRNGGNTRTFESNNIYRINIKVDKLGRFIPNEPVELDNLSMEVIDWGTASTDVEINDYRYLVLNETDFVMNNENEITVPFYSSHDVVFGDVELNYWRYNENTDGTPAKHIITPQQNEASRTNPDDPRSGIYDITVDNDKKTLTFYHDLKKTWTYTNGKFRPNNEDAYSPYTITLTVYHTDKDVSDQDYAKRITLTQYPAMYIQVERNEANSNVFINNNNTNSNYVNDKWGRRYLGYINSNRAQSGEYYIGSKNSGNGNNKNYNNYIITITKLNPTANYKIGDPRQNKINNKLSELVKGSSVVEDKEIASWSVSANSLYDLTQHEMANTMYDNQKAQRLLAFYYPTDETADKQRFVAPQFAVASSWGATLEVEDKKGARRRCASYQENGRPAGRWRLPTPGEVQYIVELSKDGKIPMLFGSSSGTTEYWTSYGYIEVNNQNKTFETKIQGQPDEPYVRCVYDEWYWKDKAPVNTFTWGDIEMDDPQNPDTPTIKP